MLPQVSAGACSVMLQHALACFSMIQLDYSVRANPQARSMCPATTCPPPRPPRKPTAT